MPTCRVIKGGWSWKGDQQKVGDLIVGQTDEWIANRVRDGLCEPVADEPSIETAVAPPPAETAVIPRPRKRS